LIKISHVNDAQWEMSLGNWTTGKSIKYFINKIIIKHNFGTTTT